MLDHNLDFETARQMHTVLVLHFLEGQKQSEIAQKLNLSHSKVNRLIAQGRKLGMIKIHIETPFQRLMERERELVETTSLSTAVVTPTVSGNADTNLQQVGKAAANLILENVRDGDVIAITGGKAVSATVDHLFADRSFNVTVVPLTGGVQGKFYTDVNHLASRMAERLGGKSMLIHAPLFAESKAQRDMLKEMTTVKEVFDLARGADLALTGIGSIEPSGSSYYDLNPVPEADRKMMVGLGVSAEFLAHLILEKGGLANFELNSRLVALAPSEITGCRNVIGVAAGPQKVQPVQAVLNGNYLNSLIVDESTVNAVLEGMGKSQHVA
ncbi:sugar-binding transcriptional regulator [Roseibium limicola]|uniref:Sugar-binding transcriptional regulator n=1 Tax=Roseibium limicola TaxID=2816037 RepID=A0A939J5X7_9HYPH|nr:sugar-binding transcriptional regulator [Roseibium limicola]MBO0346295.1 sugar-binding transcriptional regulator [Roseibium limicola]